MTPTDIWGKGQGRVSSLCSGQRTPATSLTEFVDGSQLQVWEGEWSPEPEVSLVHKLPGTGAEVAVHTVCHVDNEVMVQAKLSVWLAQGGGSRDQPQLYFLQNGSSSSCSVLQCKLYTQMGLKGAV
jgi:hypothetical protein